MIKLSIITVCYNSEKYIEQTIQSVISQTYPNIEYIVVDGMSDDKTPEIIDRYKDRISIYIRGKDKNMYDAINKGMRASTGDYISILNSDDYYWNHTVVERIMNKIENDNAKHELYVMDDYKQYEPSGSIKKQRLFVPSYLELLCSRKLTFTGHSTVYISRKCYQSIGEYDCENFHAAADFDYFLRAFRSFEAKHIPVFLMAFRVHEGSISSSGQIERESHNVLFKNGYYEISPIKRQFLFSVGWLKYILLNFEFNIRFKLQK